MKYRVMIHTVMLLAFCFLLAGCGTEQEAPPPERTIPASLSSDPFDASEQTELPELALPNTEPTEFVDPMDLHAVTDDKGKPVLLWTAVDGAASYQVYCDQDREIDGSPLATVEVTTYTHSTVPSGLSYFYQIRAVDQKGTVIAESAICRFTADLRSPETLTTCYINIPKVRLHHVNLSGADPVELPYMAEVQLGAAVQSRSSGVWYRIFYENELYYIFKKHSENTFTTTRSSFVYTGNTPLQQQAIDLAMDICNNWNTVYSYGATGQVVDETGARGFTCGSLVALILNQVMQEQVPLYWVSSGIEPLYNMEYLYNEGLPGETKVEIQDLRDLQPGDVLFFRSRLDDPNSTVIGHCGMYLGNNEFLHCTSLWEGGVCVMPLTYDFKDTLLSIHRFLPDEITPSTARATLDGPHAQYNLYAERTPDSATVGVLSQGEELTVLYTHRNRSMVQVKTDNGTVGFIPKKHLKMIQNAG